MAPTKREVLCQSLVAASVALLFSLGIYLMCLRRGYSDDEGSFCTIAQGILRGRLPYLHLFNEKPPLQYFWTAAVMRMSEPTIAGARLAPAFALAGVLACILSGVLRWHAGWARVVGWATVSALIATIMSGYNDNADTSLAFLFSASALLIATSQQISSAPFKSTLHGLLFGIATGLRVTALLPALLIAVSPEVKGGRHWYFLGFAFGLGCWLVPLLWIGLGRSFLESTIMFHWDNPARSTYIQGLRPWELSAIPLWLLCMGWAVSRLKYRPRWIWLALFLLSLPAPAFLRLEGFRLWPSTAAALVLVAFAGPGDRHLASTISGCLVSLALIAFYKHYPMESRRVLAMSEAITRMTGPSDRIWAGPFFPLSYCLTQRQPASRYYFIVPWTAKPEVRREILSDIKSGAPKLLITSDTSQLLPGLEDIVATQYELAEQQDYVSFYLRKSQ